MDRVGARWGEAFSFMPGTSIAPGAGLSTAGFQREEFSRLSATFALAPRSLFWKLGGGPPLRACFVFDDPNLHWRRYGFINFQELAKHAEKEMYHVAFATIPLDTWFSHQSTVRLFRENTKCLSLLIHGNDHVHYELAGRLSQAQRGNLLCSAIRRIERFERRTGLDVSRVMVPPHGACSEGMLGELPKWGFDYACISHGSLRAHNPTKAWTEELGYRPAELVKGCPILPRWGLAADAELSILLAAFLKQAIVLRGHHGDLRDGPEFLDGLAGVINGLGDVKWSNMAELGHGSYRSRIEGDALVITPLCRRIALSLVEGPDFLVVHPPVGLSETAWQIVATDGKSILASAGEKILLPPAFKSRISIQPVSSPGGESTDSVYRTSSWAIIRRALTEMRDRVSAV